MAGTVVPHEKPQQPRAATRRVSAAARVYRNRPSGAWSLLHRRKLPGAGLPLSTRVWSRSVRGRRGLAPVTSLAVRRSSACCAQFIAGAARRSSEARIDVQLGRSWAAVPSSLRAMLVIAQGRRGHDACSSWSRAKHGSHSQSHVLLLTKTTELRICPVQTSVTAFITEPRVPVKMKRSSWSIKYGARNSWMLRAT